MPSGAVRPGPRLGTGLKTYRKFSPALPAPSLACCVPRPGLPELPETTPLIYARW
jgi:hypothetical protein